MTGFERKQLIDRRNRMRRTHEICIGRWFDEAGAADIDIPKATKEEADAAHRSARNAERYYRLAQRIEMEQGDIAEILRFRW